MPLVRIGRSAVGVAAALFLLAGTASANSSNAPVREGGFRLFDPVNPEGNDAALLSLGPLVVGGVRNRGAIGTSNQCYEMNFALIGARKTSRGGHTIALEQKDHVVVFFVVYDCSVDGDELCVVEASDPVAVSQCSGVLGLSTRRGIRGNVRLKCKNGIDVSAPAFGLSTESQGLLRSALPDLDRKFVIKYRDKAGEEVTGADLDEKIQNFDVDALDDVVGTFLADDALPACQ